MGSPERGQRPLGGTGTRARPPWPRGGRAGAVPQARDAARGTAAAARAGARGRLRPRADAARAAGGRGRPRRTRRHGERPRADSGGDRRRRPARAAARCVRRRRRARSGSARPERRRAARDARAGNGDVLPRRTVSAPGPRCRAAHGARRHGRRRLAVRRPGSAPAVRPAGDRDRTGSRSDAVHALPGVIAADGRGRGHARRRWDAARAVSRARADHRRDRAPALHGQLGATAAGARVDGRPRPAPGRLHAGRARCRAARRERLHRGPQRQPADLPRGGGLRCAGRRRRRLARRRRRRARGVRPDRAGRPAGAGRCLCRAPAGRPGAPGAPRERAATRRRGRGGRARRDALRHGAAAPPSPRRYASR